MEINISIGLLITLLSASVVLGQNLNPTDFDYEDDVPAQAPGSRQVPVFVNVHTHPKTGFSCADKQAGHYYADPETKCAVYYVCIPNERGSLSPQSFACPNGTLFSQSTRVCASHDQVYCQLSERYYDNVHGNIDSKGQEEHYKPSPLQPWRKPQSNPQPKPQPQPRPQPQPSSQSQPPSQPQSRPQSQPQSRPQPPGRPQLLRPAPLSAPTAAPAASQNSRRGQFTSATTTTTTTTAAPVEYEYEYVDYPLPNETNPVRTGVNPPVRSKRDLSPIRRKGQLPSPFEFLSASHIITSFKCEDKVPGIAYADTETQCRMFHVCIPVSKGKLKDYQLYCDTNKRYNQETGVCEAEEKVNCARSQKFYVYNKWFRPQESRKDSWKHIKKSAKKSS